jgi:hypothetical protein
MRFETPGTTQMYGNESSLTNARALCILSARRLRDRSGQRVRPALTITMPCGPGLRASVAVSSLPYHILCALVLLREPRSAYAIRR